MCSGFTLHTICGLATMMHIIMLRAVTVFLGNPCALGALLSYRFALNGCTRAETDAHEHQQN